MDCHGDLLAEEKADVHQAAGVACVDCHGGDASAEDPERSKDPRAGFVARPAGRAAVRLCGGCHAGHFRDLEAPPCTTCHNHHDILATSDDLLGTGPSGTCAACHQPGDVCDRATQKMKAGLTQLGAGVARAQEALARAERLGMDVERPTYELSAADEALVRARVVVHGFSEEEFGKVVAEGTQVADEVEKAGLAKLEEHAYRRRWLAGAAGMLLLLAGLLAVKARRLEQRRLAGAAASPAESH